MNAQELKEFMAGRKNGRAISHFNISDLHCYGCAHSASSVPFPGAPSGERPCCSCIRNDVSESMERLGGSKTAESEILMGDDGHARLFDPFQGTMYNGAPRLYFPMDNYVTLDSHAQDEWLRQHPEYTKPVRFEGDALKVVEE